MQTGNTNRPVTTYAPDQQKYQPSSIVAVYAVAFPGTAPESYKPLEDIQIGLTVEFLRFVTYDNSKNTYVCM